MNAVIINQILFLDQSLIHSLVCCIQLQNQQLWLSKPSIPLAPLLAATWINWQGNSELNTAASLVRSTQLPLHAYMSASRIGMLLPKNTADSQWIASRVICATQGSVKEYSELIRNEMSHAAYITGMKVNKINKIVARNSYENRMNNTQQQQQQQHTQ